MRARTLFHALASAVSCGLFAACLGLLPCLVTRSRSCALTAECGQLLCQPASWVSAVSSDSKLGTSFAHASLANMPGHATYAAAPKAAHLQWIARAHASTSYGCCWALKRRLWQSWSWRRRCMSGRGLDGAASVLLNHHNAMALFLSCAQETQPRWSRRMWMQQYRTPQVRMVQAPCPCPPQPRRHMPAAAAQLRPSRVLRQAVAALWWTLEALPW
jgi:hypothetical protein